MDDIYYKKVRNGEPIMRKGMVLRVLEGESLSPEPVQAVRAGRDSR